MEIKNNTLILLFVIFFYLAYPLQSSVYKLPDKIYFADKELPLYDYKVKERLEAIFNNLVYDRRGYIQTLISKKTRIFPKVIPILEKYGIHKDYAYIIPVESDFNVKAFSRSSAAGLWQLMPATAKMYGLRVDTQIDERYLINKSSTAVCEHIKYLDQKFNDTFLTLAAYNNGEKNISLMLESQNSDNFWDCKSNSETDQYVPKVIVYKIILSNPEKYGFKPMSIEQDRNKIAEYTLSLGNKDVNLSLICSIAGISFREFYDLNPHVKMGSLKEDLYLYKYTATDIYIPESKKYVLDNYLRNNNYLADESNIDAENDLEETNTEFYTVKYSDNIESIAFKYKTNWQKIAEINDLEIIELPSGVETAKITIGQKLKIK